MRAPALESLIISLATERDQKADSGQPPMAATGQIPVSANNRQLQEVLSLGRALWKRGTRASTFHDVIACRQALLRSSAEH